MQPSRATDPDLILHPIRARIVYAIEGRCLSSGEIAREVPDVSQASLYRHIKRLVQAGVLLVDHERQAHGAVERFYRTDPASVVIDARKLASKRGKAGPYFEVYLSCLRQAFAHYIGQPRFDLKADGARFYTEFAYLTDEEQVALNLDIKKLIEAAQRRPPGENRRRRNLSYIALPEPAPKSKSSKA
jgi:DNA-binding transcriptional ArsR family regulator